MRLQPQNNLMLSPSRALTCALFFLCTYLPCSAHAQGAAQNAGAAPSLSIEVMDLLPTEPDAETNQENTVSTTDLPPMSDPNAPVDAEAAPKTSYNGVALNAINKIAARSETLEGAVGTVLRFNHLEVIAHRCQSVVDHGEKGFAALLEIWEMKVGDSPKKILQGWMFSTSPSLFSLEHPLYDISVKRCTDIDTEADAKAAAEAEKAQAEADKKKAEEEKKKAAERKKNELKKIDKTKR